MNTKTIALVANSTWNIYNFRLNIIDKLIEEGQKVVVFAPIDEYIKYKERYPQVQHVQLRYLKSYGINPIREFMLFMEFLKKYRTIRPDLILHYTVKPNIYGGIAARILKIKCIANITGLGYSFIHPSLLNKLTRKLYQFAIPFSQKVVFQNTTDLTLFLNKNIVKKEKAVLIPGSGVNSNFFIPSDNGIEKGWTTFTFIGRLLYDKGIREFVEAAKSIKSNHPNTRFWVIGDLDENNPSSVEKEELNAWIDAKYIDYWGFEKDLRPYLRKTNCVVLPSYREGLPRTILEGMSMARAIITTDVAGCRDTVDEERNGILVPAKSTKKLIEAIERFLQLEKGIQLKMGRYGRKMVEERFDSRIIANEYKKLIDESLR